MEQQHSLNAPDDTTNLLSVSTTAAAISPFYPIERSEEMEVQELMPYLNFNNEFGTLTVENQHQSMELEGILTKPATELSRMDLFALQNCGKEVLFFDPQNKSNGEPKYPGFELVLFEPTGKRNLAKATNFLSCTAVGCTSFLSLSNKSVGPGGHLTRHRRRHTASTQDVSNSSSRPLTDVHATDGPVVGAKRQKRQMDILALFKDSQLVWYKGGDDERGHNIDFCEITVADIETIRLVKFLEPANDESLIFLQKNRHLLSDTRIKFRATEENYHLMMDILASFDSVRSAWINSFRVNILGHCTLLNTPHLMLYGMSEENSSFYICRWLHHQNIEAIGFIDLRLPCSSQQINNSADCGGILWNGWRYLVLDFFTCKTSFVNELVKMCKEEFIGQVTKRQYVIKMFTYADFDAFEIDNNTTHEIMCFQKASEVISSDTTFPKSFKEMISSDTTIKVYVLFRCKKLETNIAHVEEFVQIDPDIFEEKTAKRLITF